MTKATTSTPQKLNIFNKPNLATWIIYAALLGVLLPHTAWAFAKFEPSDGAQVLGIHWIAWLLAIVFELALGVFTHKLASHNNTLSSATFKERYWNVYGSGLFVAWLVSTAANLAHSYEFAQPFIITSEWPALYTAYKIGFGSVLPLMSAMFARVLFTAHDVDTIQPQIIVQSTVQTAEPKVSKQVKPKAKKTVQLVEKQIEHIAALYNADTPPKVTDLAKDLDITRATVYKRIEQAKEQGKIIEPAIQLNGQSNDH